MSQGQSMQVYETEKDFLDDCVSSLVKEFDPALRTFLNTFKERLAKLQVLRAGKTVYHLPGLKVVSMTDKLSLASSEVLLRVLEPLFREQHATFVSAQKLVKEGARDSYRPISMSDFDALKYRNSLADALFKGKMTCLSTIGEFRPEIDGAPRRRLSFGKQKKITFKHSLPVVYSSMFEQIIGLENLVNRCTTLQIQLEEEERQNEKVLAEEEDQTRGEEEKFQDDEAAQEENEETMKEISREMNLEEHFEDEEEEEEVEEDEEDEEEEEEEEEKLMRSTLKRQREDTTTTTTPSKKIKLVDLHKHELIHNFTGQMKKEKK